MKFVKFIVSLFIIISLVAGCTESKVIEHKQTLSCNLSDLNIFPHPNGAGVTLSVLAMNKQTQKNRVIRIGDEICEGYKLYRIMSSGIVLQNNDNQTKQITYASTNIIAEPAIKLEQKNRQAVMKAEQLQKYGIPQTMEHIHAVGNSENAIVNSFTGNAVVPRQAR